MQNPGGNTGQQVYYQQQAQGNSGMMMMGYPAISEQQQHRHQPNVQMMNVQGMSNPPQMYSSTMQAMPTRSFSSGPSQEASTAQIPFQSQSYPPQMQPQMSMEQQMGAMCYQQQQQQQQPQVSSQATAAQGQQASITQQQQRSTEPNSQQQQQQQAHQPQQQQQQQQQQQPKKEETRTGRPWNPPPYSSEILNNLSNYSVSALANIGRELVQELLFRSYTLMTILTKPVDRWHQQQGTGDPEQLLQYCEYILSKITEIRVRIDRVPRPKVISEDEFIRMMAQPGEIPKTAEQISKEEAFEVQRSKLVKLNSALKNLDWMCMVSDPRLFKKYEKS